MRGLLFFVVVIFTVTSCDSPRDRRALSSTPSDIGQSSASAARIDLGNTTTTTPASVIPTDAQHCKFATDGINGFADSSTHLGNYTLCQSSADKNTMYFQLQTPPVSTTLPVTALSICFIPTTSTGTNSIYVGNPMCGQFTSPTAVRKITFVKFAQYQNAVINGAIFFKDIGFNYPSPFNSYTQTMTLDAYRICMQVISTPPYYNSSYCQAFKQVNQYVFKQF